MNFAKSFLSSSSTSSSTTSIFVCFKLQQPKCTIKNSKYKFNDNNTNNNINLSRKYSSSNQNQNQNQNRNDASKHLATFAAGCFWGIEKAFYHAPGVISTKVGYTGGNTINPTYKQVYIHEI